MTTLPFRIFSSLLMSLLVTTHNASARRAIPDDNLAYPILITLNNVGSGSGFYLSTPTGLYLVTAGHVLFDPQTHKLLSDNAELLSYSKDLSNPTPYLMNIDLNTLQKNGDLRAHPSEDIAVARLGTVSGTAATPTTMGSASFRPGVKLESGPASGVVAVFLDNVRKFDQVLTGNEVLLFGYPNSIGLQPNAQFDSHRPLLRKGIVAGQYFQRRSIILDCPAYQGDSGGPVIEIEPDDKNPFETHFYVIGVIVQFIPFVDYWWNLKERYMNTTQLNSGYSVAIPMDFALEIIKQYEDASGTPPHNP